MTTLGLSGTGVRGPNELRFQFRSGWLRSVVVGLSAGSGIAVVLGFYSLLQNQPKESFQLLERWGFWWLITLVGMYFLYDLARSGVGYLGKLADGVKDSAIAINKIAEKDDRERDRMITETAYIGQQMNKVVTLVSEIKSQNDRILAQQTEREGSK